MECVQAKNGEYAVLFIDDAYLLVTGRTIEKTHAKLKNIMEREGGVFEWAAGHNCKFGINKFQLIDMTRRREPDPSGQGKTRPASRPDLVVGNHRIPSKLTAKFLGVTIDRELRWKEQGDIMVAKGQTWVAQINRVAKVTTGIPQALIRRLFILVAIPRIMYVADVCLVAGSRQGKIGNGRVMARLNTIQCKVALAIMGALRTTALDTLYAHANLLLLPVLVDKIRGRAAVRMAAMPESHPLFLHIKCMAARQVKRHPAPLHGLMHDFPVTPDRMEKVDHTKVKGLEAPGFRVWIAKTRGEAVVMDMEDDAPFKIYTDGSGADGCIGAAAVLFREERKVSSL